MYVFMYVYISFQLYLCIGFMLVILKWMGRNKLQVLFTYEKLAEYSKEGLHNSLHYQNPLYKIPVVFMPL